MKKTAKKLLSVFLAALLALTVFAPASAASSDWRKIGGGVNPCCSHLRGRCRAL